ncbi:MAG: leucine-rich repeat domain-containing protein, partial [Myxococcota bacterium]
SLNGNRLQQVPTVIRQLARLRTLRLGSNFELSLPPWLIELRELRELDLRHTPTSDRQLDELKRALPECEVKCKWP